MNQPVPKVLPFVRRTPYTETVDISPQIRGGNHPPETAITRLLRRHASRIPIELHHLLEYYNNETSLFFLGSHEFLVF